MPDKRSCIDRLKINWLDFALLSLSLCVTLTVVAVYVRHERAIYCWDFSGYQVYTEQLVEFWFNFPGTIPAKVLGLLAETWHSTGVGQYNYIPSLILFPFLCVFGRNRLIYIMSISICYLIPFALVLGAIASRLMPSRPKHAFWVTVLLTLMTPAALLPTLRGYVDTGGAVLLCSATWIYLCDMRLARLRSILLIGILIAAAILFRRTLAVSSLSCLAAMFMQSILLSVMMPEEESRGIWVRVLRSTLRLAFIVLIMVATIAVLALPFITFHWGKNYFSLYSSNKLPLATLIETVGLKYGWMTWGLLVVGFFWGIAAQVLDRAVASFILLQGVCVLVCWIFVIGYLGIHHTLGITPIVPLGLAALCMTSWSRLKAPWRAISLTAFVMYCMLNLFAGLAPADTVSEITNRLDTLVSRIVNRFDVVQDAISLLAENNGPLHYEDRDEILRLLNYLRNLDPSGPIYVAASSPMLNMGIVQNADLLSPESKRLDFLEGSELDSRDPNPIDQLVRARYVLIAYPPQYHKAPEHQKVVRAVVELFSQDSEFAKDFVRLPVSFEFSQGLDADSTEKELNAAEVSIFSRIRPTSKSTYLATQKSIQSKVNGSQNFGPN